MGSNTELSQALARIPTGFSDRNCCICSVHRSVILSANLMGAPLIITYSSPTGYCLGVCYAMDVPLAT